MEILSMIFSVAFEIAKQKCTDPHQVLTASLLYKDKTEVTAETLFPHQPQVTNGLQRVVRVKHLSRLMVGVYNRESVVNIFFTYIIYFCLTFNLAQFPKGHTPSSASNKIVGKIMQEICYMLLGADVQLHFFFFTRFSHMATCWDKEMTLNSSFQQCASAKPVLCFCLSTSPDISGSENYLLLCIVLPAEAGVSSVEEEKRQTKSVLPLCNSCGNYCCQWVQLCAQQLCGAMPL